MPEKKYPPTVKFELDEKVWLQFRFNKPSKSTGKHGEFYNWGVRRWVTDEWKDQTLKPSNKLMLLLVNMPVKLDTTYQFMKLHEEDGDFDFFEVVEMSDEGKPISQVFSTKDVDSKPELAPPGTPPEKTFPPPPPEDRGKPLLKDEVANQVGQIYKGCCIAFGFDETDKENIPDGMFRVVNTVIMKKL